MTKDRLGRLMKCPAISCPHRTKAHGLHSGFAIGISFVIGHWSLLHVPIASQLLERILAFLVLGSPCPLGSFSLPQFLDYFPDAFGCRLYPAGTWSAADTAITF